MLIFDVHLSPTFTTSDGGKNLYLQFVIPTPARLMCIRYYCYKQWFGKEDKVESYFITRDNSKYAQYEHWYKVLNTKNWLKENNIPSDPYAWNDEQKLLFELTF